MKRHSKGVISALLCAAMLFSIGISAFAALEVSKAPENTGNESSILDEAAIKAQVEGLIQQYVTAGYVKESELAIAYTYLATGDSWYRNPDMWFYSASIYKVPLMMIMAEKEAKGEIDAQTDIMGLPLAQVEKIVLVDSNNDYAHNTMRFLTGQTDKKTFEKGTRPMYQAYSSLPENYYHKDFVEYSYFSARFMNDVMCTLHNEQSRFPNIIGLLKQANPGKYYHLVLGDNFEIAQKYGYFKDSRGTEWHNNTGIIYTPNPFVLTVLSADAKRGEQFMGDLAALFVDYTLELDKKLASYKAEQERQEQERIAAEKAAAEAEAKAKAEEEARIAKEEADRKAAEEAALRAAEKEQKAAERKASISKLLKYVGLAGAGILVILIVVGILSTIRKRKALEEDDGEMPPTRRGSRKGSEYDDEDDDYEDGGDDEDDEDEKPHKAGLGGLLRKKSAPARRRASDEDDEYEDDEDDDDYLPPRRGTGASIAAQRRRAAAEEEYEEDEEEDEEEAPRFVLRTPVKAQRTPARRAPAESEEEDEEEDIDSTLAYMKSAPARPMRPIEDEEDDEGEDDQEESRSSLGFGRGKGGPANGYRPRH